MHSLKSSTLSSKTGCGTMFVTIVHNMNGTIAHIFPQLGKSGTCPKGFLNAYCAFVTSVIQTCAKKDVIKAFAASSGHTCQYNQSGCIRVINDLILEHYLNTIESESNP